MIVGGYTIQYYGGLSQSIVENRINIINQIIFQGLSDAIFHTAPEEFFLQVGHLSTKINDSTHGYFAETSQYDVMSNFEMQAL
jgi:hypothetical protein